MEQSIQNWIADKLSLRKARFCSIGGGSINQTFRIESPGSNFFCKFNSALKFPGLFVKEKNGLQFLKNTNTIKVPEVICCEEHNGQQLLVLEWIQQGSRTNSFWKKFGEGLAALHRNGTWSDGDSPTTFRFGF